MSTPTYELVMLGEPEPCERCGALVQAHRRVIDGAMRVSDMRAIDGVLRVMPGGHTPDWCTDIRDGRIRR